MTSTITRPRVEAEGTLAGRTARFVPMHREFNPTPVLFTATVELPLSFDDLVAALWVATQGMALDEIDADPASRFSAHHLVLETIVSDNAAVTQALADIDTIRAGTADHAALVATRALVSAAFGLPEVSV